MACCFACIEAGNVGVVQRFGDFVGVQEPGCSFILWPCTTVFPISLAVRQLDCQSDCKTKDNVTITVQTAVQFRIAKDRVKTATFDVVDPDSMITAELNHILRSTIPSMVLDEAYAAKEMLVVSLLKNIRSSIGKYGFEIINVLVTDIQPVADVLQAMNEINAAKRQREAATEKGEANKVLRIKDAEADAEGKRLAGVGVASMRSALAQGFSTSMETMQRGGLDNDDAMHMMIMTQYLDTLKEFANGKASIMVPHGPSAVQDLKSQISDGFSRRPVQSRME
eukprot:TRINITY_DN18834_c0_g2_i1.p1 TRINITY_DN18834_c0_g2~~TRINITY_DN18834_c0_g2_i1.p1  ORF type:complete len:281 (-),score=71.04 TRINITY_DN18834_c0_g2_i1:19-861(-)